jgi:hypothetical protein
MGQVIRWREETMDRHEFTRIVGGRGAAILAASYLGGPRSLAILA